MAITRRMLSERPKLSFLRSLSHKLLPVHGSSCQMQTCGAAPQPPTRWNPFSGRSFSNFPSKPIKVRAPFFLIFSFNKETLKSKGKRGTTGVPSSRSFDNECRSLSTCTLCPLKCDNILLRCAFCFVCFSVRTSKRITQTPRHGLLWCNKLRLRAT